MATADPSRTEITIEPTLEAVARATADLVKALPPRVSQDDRYTMEIALAEALTNIVEHGYAGVTQPHPIMVTFFEWRDEVLVMELRDQGRPIPPGALDAAGPETFAYDPTELDALPEGGMGLALIKLAFDRVDYRSRDGVNLLRLQKRLR